MRAVCQQDDRCQSSAGSSLREAASANTLCFTTGPYRSSRALAIHLNLGDDRAKSGKKLEVAMAAAAGLRKTYRLAAAV